MDTSEDINLTGTPSELQEIVDTLREEVGTAQTEDVHLKNSGSEVTFSQFCKGAETKVRNFRTSTQNQSVSEEVVAKKTKQSHTVEESVKMDSLEYYPSSSSLSSVACVSSSQKHKKPIKIKADSEKCSESLLKPLSDSSMSKAKINHFKPDSDKSEGNSPNLKDSEEIQVYDSESVKVVSSSSSDSDIKIIKNITGSKAKEMCTAMKQTDSKFILEDVSENSESSLCEILLPSSINNPSSDGKTQKKLSMCDNQGGKSKRQNNDCISTRNVPEKYFFKAAPDVYFEVSLFVFVVLILGC